MVVKKRDDFAPAQDGSLDGSALLARFLKLTENWSDVNRLQEWPVSNGYLSQLQSGQRDPAKMRRSTLSKLRKAVQEVERRHAFEAAYVASQETRPAAESASLDHVLQLANEMAQLAQDMQRALQHHRQAHNQNVASEQPPTPLPISAESVARGLAELVRQPAASTKTPTRRVSGRR